MGNADCRCAAISYICRCSRAAYGRQDWPREDWLVRGSNCGGRRSDSRHLIPTSRAIRDEGWHRLQATVIAVQKVIKKYWKPGWNVGEKNGLTVASRPKPTCKVQLNES